MLEFHSSTPSSLNQSRSQVPRLMTMMFLYPVSTIQIFFLCLQVALVTHKKLILNSLKYETVGVLSMQITEQDKLSFLAIINYHNFFLNIENQDSTSSQAPEPLHFSYIPHKILTQVAWKGGERQPPRPLKTNYNCCPIAALQHHLQIIKHQCKPQLPLSAPTTLHATYI